MAAAHVYITFRQTDHSDEPIVDAVFSSELQAARHALANTSRESIVRVAAIKFGQTVKESLAATKATSALSVKPVKPRRSKTDPSPPPGPTDTTAS